MSFGHAVDLWRGCLVASQGALMIIRLFLRLIISIVSLSKSGCFG